MKKYINYLILIFILLFGFLIYVIFAPLNCSIQGEVVFKIEKGEGSKEISHNLQNQGFLLWAPIFRAYTLLNGTSGKLQAGTYFISPSEQNMPSLIKKFASGDVAKTRITIPEGFTALQIYERLKNFVNIDLSSLKEKEGFLFPDTYDIVYRTKGEEVIKMMTENFDKKVTVDLKTEIEKQKKTLKDIVIMASLIEKEVATKEDKEIVSGILWKRIKNNMPLQVDADMWTYKNKGLPEAPICNPGLETIKAAIYPKDSPYWFYLSTPEGKTIFSKTYEEHVAAKEKYLK
ncbi:MAG: endolytic transglycosylase MltG [Candidatus Pacebacteria bacterium]|nr:endolytic transglycosylase MltG [Candidatus Paceibacterota bacterium]